jgi:hypothetical protein
VAVVEVAAVLRYRRERAPRRCNHSDRLTHLSELSIFSERYAVATSECAGKIDGMQPRLKRKRCDACSVLLIEATANSVELPRVGSPHGLGEKRR